MQYLILPRVVFAASGHGISQQSEKKQKTKNKKNKTHTQEFSTWAVGVALARPAHLVPGHCYPPRPGEARDRSRDEKETLKTQWWVPVGVKTAQLPELVALPITLLAASSCYYKALPPSTTNKSQEPLHTRLFAKKGHSGRLWRMLKGFEAVAAHCELLGA